MTPLPPFEEVDRNETTVFKTILFLMHAATFSLIVKCSENVRLCGGPRHAHFSRVPGVCVAQLGI